jgi:hypothetical protein
MAVFKYMLVLVKGKKSSVSNGLLKKGNLFNSVKSNNNVMISHEGIKQTVQLKRINET